VTEFPYTLVGEDLWAWRSQALTQASRHQINPAEVDWFLQALCQIDGLALRLGTIKESTVISAQVTLADLAGLWQQRVDDRVPVQHLVGQTTWRDLALRVSPAVLIPRPETELIIELATSAAAQSPQADSLQRGTWADLGTGSGAIALGLARALPPAEILAVDISAAALAIAQQNAVENGLSDRVQFFQGAWFEPLSSWRGKVAGMVSNPPYIPKAMVATLEPEVARHEPHLALDGGEDGLAAIRHLAATAPTYLRSGGIWLIEHMQGQATAIMALVAATQQFTAIQSIHDLAGCDRFVLAYRC
jgi:release factor glutamine methyltransferase